MTKLELIEKVSEITEISKADTKKVFDCMIEEITRCMTQGDRVQISGFGIFEVRKRAARVGKNPRTGESMIIPETTTPAFKAGKALKDAVNP